MSSRPPNKIYATTLLSKSKEVWTNAYRCKGSGVVSPPPNDKKVGVRGTLKSAIKSIHWNVALKRKCNCSFLSEMGRIFIAKRVFPWHTVFYKEPVYKEATCRSPKYLKYLYY